MSVVLRAAAGRAGASLVEMVLVLVLGGLITTAAVSLIAPTNELAAEATASAEVEEGARSTLDLIASTLRRVPQGGIMVATRDSVVVALPLAMGAFCANDGSRLTAYLGLGGRTLDIPAVDGYAFRDPSSGQWAFAAMSGTQMFSGSTPGRSVCVATGGGLAGFDSDYTTFYASTNVVPGTGFLVYDRQTFRFGPSVLAPTTRGLHYGATGAPLLEVSLGLHSSSHFEYRLRGTTTWYPALSSTYTPHIDAIRVIAGGATDASSALIAREIPLMNSE